MYGLKHRQPRQSEELVPLALTVFLSGLDSSPSVFRWRCRGILDLVRT